MYVMRYHWCVCVFDCERLVLATHSNMQRGNTALIISARDGRADCVRLLLDGGADKDAKNNVRVVGRVLYSNTFWVALGADVAFFLWFIKNPSFGVLVIHVF